MKILENIVKTEGTNQSKGLFWLLLWDRLMTREILMIRGCNMAQECVLCDTGSLESRDYLFGVVHILNNFG